MIAVPGIGLGVAAGAFVRRLELGHGFSPKVDLPDLVDFDDDEASEPEPPGIEYDENDAPCVGPPPSPEPVAMGLEGADTEFCTPPADLEPDAQTEVEFAMGAARPHWPLDTTAKRKLQVSYKDVRGKWHGRWGRAFGIPRKGKKGERIHVGIDLFADPGDVVLASEDGEVIATLPFYQGTGALYLLTDSGMIVNYGELEHRSWSDFGIKSGIGSGQRVNAGDPIARIGVSDTGSHMLHLETYTPDVTIDQIRRGEMQWPKDEPPPFGILDPTRYLVRSQRVRYEQMVEDV